ncbi:MAG: YdbH domain-containing protein [Pseudomonadota bacterium]
MLPWASRTLLALIAAVMNAAILAVLAWLFIAPRFAGEIILVEAQRAGVPVTSLTVDRLWSGGVALSDIEFDGGSPFVRRALVTFQRRDLTENGEVETVEISGARLTLAIDESGAISIEGLEPLLQGSADETEPFSIPQLPVQEIVLDDTRVSLSTPLGPAGLTMDATLRPIDHGGAILTASLAPEWRDQRAAILLQGRVDADGAFDAVASLASDRVAWEDVRLTGADGWLAASGSPAGLTAIEGELQAASVAIGDRQFGGTRLFALGQDLPDLLTVRTESLDGSVRLAADVGFIDWAAGTPDLEIDATIGAQSLHLLGEHLPVPAGTDGEVLIDVSAVVPLSAVADPLAFPLIGDIAVWVRRLGVPGLVDDVSATIAADVAWDGERLALASAERWQAVGWLKDLDQPFNVSLAPLDDELTLILDRDATGGALRSLVQVGVGGVATVSTDVAIVVDGDGAEGRRIDIERLEGTISPLNLDGLTVTPLVVSLTGEGEEGGFVGDLSVRVAANGSSPAISVDNGAVALDGRVETDWSEIAFFAEGCQFLAFDRLAIERTPLLPTSGPVCLEGLANRPLFTIPTDLQGVTAIQGLIAGFAARIDPDNSPLDASIGTLTIAGSLVDGVNLDLGLEGAALDIPNDGILIDGIAGEVAMRATDDGAIGLSGPVMAEGIIIAGRPQPMVPLAVEASISGTLNQPFIEGVGLARNLGLSFPARFLYDGPTGVGRVEVDVPGLRFTPDGLQPTMLFPILEDSPFDTVDGRMTGDVLILFGAESVNSASIRLNDVTFQRPEITLSGVNGTVRLSNFAPPRMPAGQQLSIGEAEFGPLFRDGSVTFGLQPGNTLAVSELGFDWAGGQVSAEPFSFDIDNINTEVTLQARGVSLEEILLEFPVEDLSASGILDGTLPTRLQGDAVFVDNGRLQTRGPGVIRYAPQESGDVGEQGLQIFFDAVRNFHYERVAVTLDGDSIGDLALGFEIVGNNPDLYGGYPIDLNVNVSGDLADILRQSVRVLSIGDEAREFFEDGRGRDTIETLLDQ